MNKELEAFKEAARKYFIEGTWNEQDEQMIALKEATNWEAVGDALFQFADYIGDRKGWGADGVGSLQQEFIEEIEKRSGVEFIED